MPALKLILDATGSPNVIGATPKVDGNFSAVTEIEPSQSLAAMQAELRQMEDNKKQMSDPEFKHSLVVIMIRQK